MARTLAFGIALLVVLMAAHAADPSTRAFSIERQPLSTALRAFAEQAQVQLIFSEQDVSGLTSGLVAGQLPTRAALAALLHGTALEFELTQNNVAVVRRARALVTAPKERRPEASRE